MASGPVHVSIVVRVARALYELRCSLVRDRRVLRRRHGDPWAEWRDLGGES